MKFTSAATLAVFCTVMAAPANQGSDYAMSSPFVSLNQAQESMVNHQQVQDTLNNQLHKSGAHATADELNAFITGADSQADIALANMGQALAPFTGGMSEAIANVLLGPYVQAVTNGAEVFFSNLVGNAIDGVSPQQLSTLTRSYARVSEFASKYGVENSQLTRLTSEINKKAATSHAHGHKH